MLPTLSRFIPTIKKSLRMAVAQGAQKWGIKVGVIGGSGLYKLEGIEKVATVNPETVSWTCAEISAEADFWTAFSPGDSRLLPSQSARRPRALTSPSLRDTVSLTLTCLLIQDFGEVVQN